MIGKMSFKEHPPQPEAIDAPIHVPVLLEASLNVLKPQLGESYLDLTAGYGGHAGAFLKVTKNYSNSYLVDRDERAIATLQSFSDQGTALLNEDFVAAAQRLVENGKQFDIVLADLGVSSPQLDIAERGFSFTHDGPLDMRMDRRQDLTAEKLVNTARADELVDIICRYGEEPRGFAKIVASAIIDARPLGSTRELADLVKSVYRGRWKKIHPATRTFQALRIAVNQELRQVELLLPLLPKLLKSGGRVGVISFHSLEDRLVKQYFRSEADAGYEAQLEVITKKPYDGATYDVHNPRSRSAKLRAAVKK